MGTLYEISIMCFEVPTGVVADLVSRRLSASVGWFFLGLGFFLEGLFPVVWVVIGAQLLLGFGETFVSGAHDAWVADELPHADPGVDSGTAFLKGQQSSFQGRILGGLDRGVVHAGFTAGGDDGERTRVHVFRIRSVYYYE